MKRKIALGCSLALFVGSMATLLFYGVNYYLEEQVYSNLRELHTKQLSFSTSNQSRDYKGTNNALKDVNSDYVGWITVKGTKIDYPIVYCKDNTKYLNTNFYGDASQFGCIFMDMNNLQDFSDEVVILYGHRMKDGSMFAGLKYYQDEKYLKRHNEIQIELNDGTVYKYLVKKFAQVPITSGIYQFDTQSIETLTPYNENSKYLVLSTCTGNGHADRTILISERLN